MNQDSPNNEESSNSQSRRLEKSIRELASIRATANAYYSQLNKPKEFTYTRPKGFNPPSLPTYTSPPRHRRIPTPPPAKPEPTHATPPSVSNHKPCLASDYSFKLVPFHKGSIQSSSRYVPPPKTGLDSKVSKPPTEDIPVQAAPKSLISRFSPLSDYSPLANRKGTKPQNSWNTPSSKGHTHPYPRSALAIRNPNQIQESYKHSVSKGDNLYDSSVLVAKNDLVPKTPLSSLRANMASLDPVSRNMTFTSSCSSFAEPNISHIPFPSGPGGSTSMAPPKNHTLLSTSIKSQQKPAFSPIAPPPVGASIKPILKPTVPSFANQSPAQARIAHRMKSSLMSGLFSFSSAASVVQPDKRAMSHEPINPGSPKRPKLLVQKNTKGPPLSMMENLMATGIQSRIIDRQLLQQHQAESRARQHLNQPPHFDHPTSFKRPINSRPTAFERRISKKPKVVTHKFTDDPNDPLSECSSGEESLLALRERAANSVSLPPDEEMARAFRLEEARLVMELDQEYSKPKPTPKSTPEHVGPRNYALLERANNVYHNMRSLINLSLHESVDPRITGTSCFFSVRVLSSKYSLPNIVTTQCEVIHQNSRNRKMFQNDKDLHLDMGDKVLINFLLNLPGEGGTMNQLKGEKIKVGARINVYSPATRIMSANPNVTRDFKPSGCRVAILSYRFKVEQVEHP